MSLEIKAFGLSDVGRKRKRNEDAYVIAPDVGLYAVADGMGGHSAGDVASQRAIEVVRASLAAQPEVLRAFAEDHSPERGLAAARLVEQAIQAACADLHASSTSDPRLRGMGTTFVCLVIAGDRGVVAHVGDSRLYLHRRGGLHVLTEDHTLIAEQIKAGEVTPENAKNSPFKGVLTRALGHNPSVQVDSLVVDLLVGDAFLLCSDGLHGYFTDDELSQRFAANTTEGLSNELVAVANERGGRDNITALIVSIPDEGEAAQESVARIDFLRRIPLFQHLTYREQNEVLAVAQTRAYPAGSVIVREGEPGGDLFVVIEGHVVIERGGLPIAKVGAGGHIGEMGLVDAGPRSASVRAAGPIRAMVIRRDDVLMLMQRSPALAVKLLWAFVQVLSQRLRATNTELSEVLGGPETTRL